MYIQRRGKIVVVDTPAKVNLSLEVLARREDGFHDVETVMVAIDRFDTLYFEVVSDGPISLDCDWALGIRAQKNVNHKDGDGSPFGDLPEGTDNIVVKAVRMIADRAGVQESARLRLVKRIPSAAGLGGGSSDAAAALAAANLGWNLGWPRERLSELAAELGSDVPFFLTGGAAVCRGRGERIEPIPAAKPLHFVVVRPPSGLSTAEVYQRCQPAAVPRCSQPIIESLCAGNGAKLSSQLFNRLQSPAMELDTCIAGLHSHFEGIDCLGHQLSGSGTSYFGIFRSARHAGRMARMLRGRNIGHVFRAKSLAARTSSE